MKKGTLLQADISAVIARLGHTDSLAIADAGLPIPQGPERIDLALTNGIPSFMQVLNVVTQEMQVEQITLAEEIRHFNPHLHQQILDSVQQLQSSQQNTIAVKYISHESFKALTQNSKAMVRSGECSPYANILLHAGVTF